MTIQKTWSTIIFSHNEAQIEVSLNYQTKKFSLSHDNNDENITFENENIDSYNEEIIICFDRAKCVTAALKYIKQELDL